MKTKIPTDILNHPDVERLIALSLDEDGINNDLTTRAACFKGGKAEAWQKEVRATVVIKSAAVLSGGALLQPILRLADMEKSIRPAILLEDGHAAKENTPWIILEGPAADILRIERTLLNFLMRMCGIATYTRRAVDAATGSGCKVLHTRKTAPGHRRSDIYAALCGGAVAHRRSLDDAILVKENHVRFASSFQSLSDGIQHYRSQASFVEIEVTNFTELKYALAAKPDRIMLDNFAIADVKRAVDLFGSSVQLEASGGITIQNAAQYAATGVDFISMGSLTHSAPATDLSLLFGFEP